MPVRAGLPWPRLPPARIHRSGANNKKHAILIPEEQVSQCPSSSNNKKDRKVVSDRILEVVKTIEDGCKSMETGFNLPRECYVDPEFYEFEQEAVFMRSWLCLGRGTVHPLVAR